ncbi:Protein SET DOMAIN GROUP 40 [Hirschfeldia incana]|nr:Protein SET DOMAIN GROUP 40 [Hirschfeldia incana]
MESEHQNMEQFLRWAAELGVSDSIDPPRSHDSCLGRSLSVADFPLAGGRGLGAVRELRKGELVLKVPRNALLTTESLLAKDENLRDSINLHRSLSSTQVLSVCLLYEMSKGKSSLWYPYLFHLPRDYDLLATFGEFEKQALQVEDAVWAAEKAVSKSQSEWKEAVTLMKELDLKPKFQSLHAWNWASATISSRTLHIPWDSAGCLCPVGDLFNYDAPGDVSDTLESPETANSTTNQECWNNAEEAGHVVETQSERLTDGGFDGDANAYCLYARRNYQQGEQVLLCYGTYTNLELLEHYGFILEENSNDKVFIPLETTHYTLASSWPKDSLYIHQDGKLSFALVSTLRLWLIPQSQRDKSVMRLVYAGSQISVKNEILVMKWVSEKCRSVLKDLPTSLLEDRVILQEIDKLQDSELRLEQREVEAFGSEVRAFLDVNRLISGGVCGKINRRMSKWRLAVQWRLRYKRTLADCISYCNEKINHLSATY